MRHWSVASAVAWLLFACQWGSTAAAAERSLACRQTPEALELLADGQLVLRYHTAVAEPPQGIDPVYRRSGFIHPVQSPSGRCLTADFPPDHAHQHGLFNAWVNTTFQGRQVDFWNQAGKTGSVEHRRVVSTGATSNSAEFTVELQHTDLSAPDGPVPVLKELWTVRLLAHPTGRLFDIESRQTCIADSPLIVNEYHYGGMGFRGSSEWFAEKGQPATDFEFQTSEGRDRIQGNHTRPRWVVAHGTLDGAPCGLAVMGHPENFRHPEPVRLHPTKPYFVFAPCVLGEFRLEPGVEHVARYRYFVFDGPIDQDAINAVWQDYTRGAAAK